MTTHPLPLTAPPIRRFTGGLPRVAPPRSRPLARALGAGSLLAITAASVLLVLMAAERPSAFTPTATSRYFPAWMAGPLHGLLGGLTGSTESLMWQFSWLMMAMYVLYVLAFVNAERVRARWTIGALAVIHLAFLLAPPMQYTDVFNYVNYGRMGVLHNLNPYTVIPVLEPHGDAAFPLSNWHHLLSPYGPLFTLFTYALVPLGVAGSFWAIKLALALASFGTLLLVWRCAGLLGRSRPGAVAFVGLNPIFLVWGLGADHNDTLMLFFVVLAVYLFLRSPARPRAAGAWLMVAVFIKASAALLLPIFLAAGNRRGFIRAALVAGVLLGVLSLIFFGPHPPGLGTQSRLVTAVGIPNLIGLALGQGGETATLHTLIDVVLLLVLGACTWAVVRGRMHWLTAGAVVLAALTVSLSWAVPWYLEWVLPFAALAPARRTRAAVVVLGAYFLLAFMPAGYLLDHDLHFRPQATRLGLAHRAEIEALLR